ncbi:MAG: fused MFS/spermidine synthase [Bacteroidetes bacterium]|nr:fused MFS/spermidine synthase [Bacteroidota bacterium]
MKEINLLKTWYVYPVLLIEGASLMGVELVGAKLVAPSYGSSIYVWAAVLSVTLAALTIGYFTGGKLSMRNPTEKMLFIIITLAALAVFIMPFTGKMIMHATLGFDLRLGVILSCVVFLAPPLFLFGIVGPMVVRLASKSSDEVGKTAGRIYFISTIGGIFGTFIYGFYLIPQLGIKTTIYLTFIALILLPIGFLLFRKLSHQLLETSSKN